MLNACKKSTAVVYSAVESATEDYSTGGGILDGVIEIDGGS